MPFSFFGELFYNGMLRGTPMPDTNGPWSCLP
jgi:hypothetical protein